MADKGKGKAKGTPGNRNPERKNGKAWSKKKDRTTGKGKPSGNSIGGVSKKKLEARAQQARFLDSLKESLV